jgi:DNA-binding NtrC family response regulator
MLNFALSAGCAGNVGRRERRDDHFLVSDINMPGMSGLDLIPEVKVRRPDLPVFMISDYSDPEGVKMALMNSLPSGRFPETETEHQSR